MNDYLFFIPIAIALAIGVISPGPSFLFVAHTAMNKSRAHGFATSLGMGTGALLLALIAMMGLFVVLQTIPVLYVVLKVLGGMYLFYIAYKLWKSADEPIISETQSASKKHLTVQHGSLHKAYFLGLLTQLSNPKTAIVIGGIFMAFLPAQIPEYSIFLLSLMAFIIDASWYMIVSVMLTTSHAQTIYLRFKKHINRMASGLMGFLGLKLAFNQ
jgi:threonine/homoserine/homoserine lactone efflux protein